MLAHYKFNLSVAARRRRRRSPARAARSSNRGCATAWRSPATPRQTFYNKIDLLSLGIALVLGTAGLPHILIRFYTVPTAKAARKSVLWAIGIIGVFYLFTLALGFGAAALVGGKAITAQDKAGNTAAPQLAQALGTDFFGGDLGGVDAAGDHRGGRVRHDPRGGRRADPGVVVERWRTTSTPT